MVSVLRKPTNKSDRRRRCCDGTATVCPQPGCDRNPKKDKTHTSEFQRCRRSRMILRSGREITSEAIDQSMPSLLPMPKSSHDLKTSPRNHSPASPSLSDFNIHVMSTKSSEAGLANSHTIQSDSKASQLKYASEASTGNIAQETGTSDTQNIHRAASNGRIRAGSGPMDSPCQTHDDGGFSDASDDCSSPTTIKEVDSDDGSNLGDGEVWFTIIREFPALGCEQFRRLRALLDTGSKCNIISSKLVDPRDYIRLSSETEPMIIDGFANGRMSAIGVARLVCVVETLAGKRKGTTIHFCVMAEEIMTDHDALFSKNTSQKLNLVCFPSKGLVTRK